MNMLENALKVLTVNGIKVLRGRNVFPRSLSTTSFVLNHETETKSVETLNISNACVDRLKKITGKNFLRVIVDGGGCSGFQYRFDLDSEIKEDDKVFEKDGVKIVVDEISLPFLNGSTVDYHEELIRSAFRIIDNPQAEKGCSCGASFNVKM